MTVTLRCTVRGCGEPLLREDRRWVCAKKHSFDVSRAGFVNLLQPQDKKSSAPGDPREVVEARRRLLDLGVAAPLTEALRSIAVTLAAGDAVLDIGCGEGTHLVAAAAARDGLEPWGVDISVPAIEAAAKRHRGAHWVVANADRGLPFADASFALALSVTGRRDAAELARVLEPGGRAVLVVPAADDLAELREVVQGEARSEDRLAKVRAELSGAPFDEERAFDVSHRVDLSPDALRDVLATTYRGARHKERARADSLAAMTVTFAWRAGVFRRRR